MKYLTKDGQRTPGVIGRGGNNQRSDIHFLSKSPHRQRFTVGSRRGELELADAGPVDSEVSQAIDTVRAIVTVIRGDQLRNRQEHYGLGLVLGEAGRQRKSLPFVARQCDDGIGVGQWQTHNKDRSRCQRDQYDQYGQNENDRGGGAAALDRLVKMDFPAIAQATRSVVPALHPDVGVSVPL